MFKPHESRYLLLGLGMPPHHGTFSGRILSVGMGVIIKYVAQYTSQRITKFRTHAEFVIVFLALSTTLRDNLRKGGNYVLGNVVLDF
jgi:hypothetical protein